MTTDNEAAAVEAIDMALREWFGDATGAGLDGGPEHVEWRRRMRAAIAAHTAASAGEAVVWVPFVRDFLAEYDEHEEDEWSEVWRGLAERARHLCGQAIDRAEAGYLDGLADDPALDGWGPEPSSKVAQRPEILHTTAAVPADALERLVEKWRENESTCLLRAYTIRHECADELAALIPKGADHGQR